MGTSRPSQAAERALAQARRFPGDRYLGRLRWATAHRASSELPDQDRLGPVKGGVVTVSLPSDSDHGRDQPIIGGLRLSDGRPLWTRTGTVVPDGTTDDVGAAAINAIGDGNRVAAFDIRTGRGLWCASLPTHSSEEPLHEPVVTADGDVLDFGDHSITSLHARTGKLRWRIPSRADGAATGAGLLVEGTNDSRLYAYRLSDGARLWRANAVSGILGVTAGRVLIEDNFAGSVRVGGLDLGTGRQLWSRQFVTQELVSRLVNDRLLVADDNSRISALQVGDGSPIWSARVRGGLDPGSGAHYRHWLYTPDDNGGLDVLDTSRGTVSRTLTNLPWPPGIYQPDTVMASDNDVRVGDGILIVQIRNLTLAFDLPH